MIAIDIIAVQPLKQEPYLALKVSIAAPLAWVTNWSVNMRRRPKSTFANFSALSPSLMKQALKNWETENISYSFWNFMKTELALPK